MKSMTTDRLFQVLSDIHPLTEDFKEALKTELQLVVYPKGHYLLQAQAAAQHAYFLQKGFSVSYLYEEGHRVVTDFWKPGEIIMAPKSFFYQSQTDKIIQLTADSELLSLSYISTIKLFETFPVANSLARAITADYHARSEERIIDLHNLDARERYTKLLKLFPGLEMNVSQELIASYLNVTRSTLSRLRRKRN